MSGGMTKGQVEYFGNVAGLPVPCYKGLIDAGRG